MVARADRHAARAAALAHSDPLRAAFHAARAEHHRAQLRFGADKRGREDDNSDADNGNKRPKDEQACIVTYHAVHVHCTYVLPGRFSDHDANELDGLARLDRSAAQVFYFGTVNCVSKDDYTAPALTDFPNLLSSRNKDIGRTAVSSVDINMKSNLAIALKETLTDVEVANRLYKANRILFRRLMMHLHTRPEDSLGQLESRQNKFQAPIIDATGDFTSAIEALAETLLYYDTAMLRGYDTARLAECAPHVIDRMASLAPIQTSGDGPEFAIFADWDDLGSVLLVRRILAARAGTVTLVATGTPVSEIAAQKALMWARMLGEWLHEACAGGTGAKSVQGKRRSIRVKLASDSRQNTWVNSEAQQVRGVYDRGTLQSYLESAGRLEIEISRLLDGKAMTIWVDKSLTVRTRLETWPPPESSCSVS